MCVSFFLLLFVVVVVGRVVRFIYFYLVFSGGTGD